MEPSIFHIHEGIDVGFVESPHNSKTQYYIIHYTVTSGDTLSSIARKFHITVELPSVHYI